MCVAEVAADNVTPTVVVPATRDREQREKVRKTKKLSAMAWPVLEG